MGHEFIFAVWYLWWISSNLELNCGKSVYSGASESRKMDKQQAIKICSPIKDIIFWG